MNNGILVVDDDDAHRGMLRTMLRSWGYTVDEAADGDEAVALVREKAFDVVLTDVRMARMDGIHALKGILEYNPALPVVLMTAYSSVETAVEALRLGAYDYLVKPLDFEALKHTLEQAIEHSRLSVENRELRRQLTNAAARPDILGRSQAIKDMLQIISTVAPTEATVLITGESGTGKELVARALHKHSPRAGGPFVAINTAAIPKDLLESELFGHERGAFTGAQGLRRGRFEQAEGGTLFLDEIGDMPLYLQSRLLRVLSEREVMPVGSIHAVKVDIRIIAATHHDLQANIAAGKFREDLYYRLNGLNVVLPCLRERDDFDYALQTVLRHVARNNGLAPKPVSAEAMNIMRRHRWPGNIRQLANALEVALHSAKGAQIQPEDLPDYLYAHRPSENPSAPTGNTQNSKAILQDPASLQNALQAAGGCVSRLARDLGVSRMTVYRYLKKYGAAE